MTDIVERLRAPGGPIYADERREATLKNEIERLRAALQWYADDGSTHDGIDIGQRARAALEGK